MANNKTEPEPEPETPFINEEEYLRQEEEYREHFNLNESYGPRQAEDK